MIVLKLIEVFKTKKLHQKLMEFLWQKSLRPEKL
jgi:hypothetical protein